MGGGGGSSNREGTVYLGGGEGRGGGVDRVARPSVAGSRSRGTVVEVEESVRVCVFRGRGCRCSVVLR